nr:hypothetical protein C5167_019762 [Ipomoea batatas]
MIAFETRIVVAGEECRTQIRPFKPIAISKESFLPRASRTGHVGELKSIHDKPVDDSNMYPSLRGPNSAAFPEATETDSSGFIPVLALTTRA